jgi:hypothetical protein
MLDTSEKNDCILKQVFKFRMTALLLQMPCIHTDRSKEVWRTVCKMHKNEGNQIKVQAIDGRKWAKIWHKFLQETRKQYNRNNDTGLL